MGPAETRTAAAATSVTENATCEKQRIGGVFFLGGERLVRSKRKKEKVGMNGEDWCTATDATLRTVCVVKKGRGNLGRRE
jgi:hypothetical protein